MSLSGYGATCGQCGTALAANVRFCPKCGGAAVSRAPGAIASSVPAPARVRSGAVHTTSLRPAGFWIRLLAFLIDLVVVAAPALVAKSTLPVIGPIAVWWLYFALLESSSWQATVGKRVLRLKVTDVNAIRVRFGRTTARFFAKFLSTLPLGAGYVLAAFTDNKQALHDFVASTRVVYR